MGGGSRPAPMRVLRPPPGFSESPAASGVVAASSALLESLSGMWRGEQRVGRFAQVLWAAPTLVSEALRTTWGSGPPQSRARAGRRRRDCWNEVLGSSGPEWPAGTGRASWGPVLREAACLRWGCSPGAGAARAGQSRPGPWQLPAPGRATPSLGWAGLSARQLPLLPRAGTGALPARSLHSGEEGGLPAGLRSEQLPPECPRRGRGPRLDTGSPRWG